MDGVLSQEEISALLNDNSSMDAVTEAEGLEQLTPEEIDAILDHTAALSRTIVRAYQEYYAFICPLTAGTDSRAVFSVLKCSAPDLPCFTFRHKGFTDQTAEIAVPSQICKATRHSYTAVNDLTAPEEFVNAVRQTVGPYSDITGINHAYTFLSNFKGKAQADGSIIDEVGKSTQENAVPVPFLNTGFFMCKLHNYEPGAKQEVKRYVERIVQAGERQHMADLFAWEQKLGRRVGQGATLYALCGIDILSIFNCREIILQWTRIPRKNRVTKKAPRFIIETSDAHLMEFPFNPEDKLITLAKKNWVVFYLATFAKHYLSKFRTSH